MTLQELIDYYSNLLIIQYTDLEKAKGTIAAMVEVILSNNLALDVQDAFNIETATGVNLDIIGKYAGIDRFYTEIVYPDTYFGFSNASEDEETGVTGFADASDFFTKDGIFIEAKESFAKNNELNDANYRTLIKLKIIQNNINHSNKSIDDAIYNTFGSDVFALDAYNMSMAYFVPDSLTAVMKVALQKEVLPRPMAVLIQGILINKTYFSFASALGYESNSQGFSDNSDFLTKEGTFLSFDDFITV